MRRGKQLTVRKRLAIPIEVPTRKRERRGGVLRRPARRVWNTSRVGENTIEAAVVLSEARHGEPTKGLAITAYLSNQHDIIS